MINTFTFLAFGAYFGIMEAIMFHIANWQRLKEFNRKRDIHQVFTLIRIAAYFTIWGMNGEALMFALPCVAMFPFVHDGIYYQMRNLLEPTIYTKGFISEPSRTGTAITGLSFVNRTISFVVGLAACIILELYWAL